MPRLKKLCVPKKSKEEEPAKKGKAFPTIAQV